MSLFEDEAEFAPPSRSSGSRPHSGPGIASFVVIVLSGVWEIAMVALAGMLVSLDPPATDEDPRMIAVGLGIIAGGFGVLVSLVLGVVGLCQSDRNRLFALLGILFSLLVVLGVGGLMVIGLMAG